MAGYAGIRRARASRRDRSLAGYATFFGVFALIISLLPQVPILAAPGDFSLDFAAAAPFSYSHTTGGGAWDDGTVGRFDDVVESLNGGDFACEDVVTYFTKITVDARAAGAQTIELDYSFAASPTGQDGVGHVDILGAQINYGVVADLIEGNHTDSGMKDDGSSVATLVSEELVDGPLFTGKSRIVGTISVTDLEPGEVVILRVDTRIGCDDDPATNPTGELQARITAGRTAAPDSRPIQVGNQTIPFKNLAELTPANPGISVTKAAAPTVVPEPGGTVTYTVVVSNTGDIGLTLNALVDDQFGDLAAASNSTCATPQTIAVGGSYGCNFEGNVSGNAGFLHTNEVTGTALDDEGTQVSDSGVAAVTVADVPPAVRLEKSVDFGSLPEPGGVFTFTLTVTNLSAEAVTITALSDSNVLSAECLALVGVVLAPAGAEGDQVSCLYTVTHTNPGSYNNTASVTVVDDDGSSAAADDDETVTVTDGPIAVSLDKVASPVSLPEPGGVFTFTLTVTNTSPEAVTITALSDSNVLSAECLALVGVVLAPAGAEGDQVSCLYTVTHTNPGSYNNTASVTVVDDEQNQVSDTAEASVTVTDVAPVVSLGKVASPVSLPEPGGVFTFTLTVANLSVEAVTITALSDSNVLSAECLALVGVVLAPAGAEGDQVSCLYTVTHTNSGSYNNTASVTVVDDEQNEVSDRAEAGVTVTGRNEDVDDTDLAVVKTGSVSAVLEGDNAVYTITVTNNGPLAESNAVATDTLPDTFVFVSATPSQGTCSHAAGVISCRLGSLDAGSAATIAVSARTSRFGTYTNVVIVSGDQRDRNPANNRDEEVTSVVQVLPQVVTAPTTTSAAPETLPFTGPVGGGLGGFGAALMVLGGLMLWASRRSAMDWETAAAGGWTFGPGYRGRHRR